MGKQVCIIPFRMEFLLKYTNQYAAYYPLEVAESVDMMRILEHGLKVRMVPTRHDTHAVDTPEDLARVEKLMQSI
jgi:3-deoxy-manno-octulosonate cytidylyltransferase (CMP-KDO synthetase)